MDAVPGQSDRPPENTVAGPPRAGRLRKWLPRLLLLVLSPLLFLGLLEGSLRLAGYGYPTSFLIWSPQQNAYIGNDKFAWRFTSIKPTPEPDPLILPATKAPGAVRIFILGESAAMGVPDPSFSFWRILQVMLRQQYPKARFEIINAAMMGINSHAILPIARECAQSQPDVFIVYMGNNEACGFFGPMTVSAGSDLPSLSAIRASLWLKSWRTGQLISHWTGKDKSAEPQDLKAFLTHQVAAHERRCQSVADRLRGNLSDILDLARGAAAKTVVCTVAVNLKDCPPLGSLHRAGLSPADKTSFDQLYAQAATAENAKRPAEAIEKYSAAEKIDDLYAELHFRLARCLLAERRPDEARRHFILARDLDSLQFRTDSRINEVIRQVAGNRQGQGVELVDVEKAFAQNPAVADHVVGDEFFYEHAHLRFDGNFALAQAILPAVQAALPESVRESAVTPNPPLTRDRCAQLLALSPQAELRMAEPIAALAAKPPFTNQCDNAARQAALTRQVEELRQRADAADTQQLIALYEAALASAPDDWRIHHNYADLLLARGKPAQAAEQLRLVLRTVPHHRTAEYFLGQVLLQQGKMDEAIAHYRAMMERRGDCAAARRGLADALVSQRKYDEALEQYRQLQKASPCDPGLCGAVTSVLTAQGKFEVAAAEIQKTFSGQPLLMQTSLARLRGSEGKADAAIDHLQKAVVLAPDNLTVRVELGAALLAAGKPDQAIEQYNAALAVDPRHVPALNGIGSALLATGRADAAVECLQKVLAIRPDFSANLSLGNLAAARRQLAAAEEYYLKAIALDSRNATVRHNLGSVLLARQKVDEAVGHLTAAVHVDPNYASAHHLLGQALKRQGKPSEALKHFRRALELKFREPELLSALAWIMATSPDDTLRQGSEAVALAEEACEKTLYKSWRHLDVLAAAYAEAGRFDQAIRVATIAAQSAASEGRAAETQAIKSRAELYQSKKPYRE